MSKETGLGWTALTIDDASGTPVELVDPDSGVDPVTNLSWATPRAVQDVTGIGKSAMERLLLLADMSTTYNGVFDPGASSAHSVFRTIPSTSVARTTLIQISGQELDTELLYTDYGLTRNQDGSFTWTVPGVLADGTVPTWDTVA
jgi:hypothetical protein